MEDDENGAALNLKAGSSDRSSYKVSNSLEVSLGGALCLVTAVYATRVTCNLTAPSSRSATGSSFSSSNEPGLVPLRVVEEVFGRARSSVLPLFTVQHLTFTVTPKAGSLDEEPTAGHEGMIWSYLERIVEQATNKLFKLILLGAACVRSPKVN